MNVFLTDFTDNGIYHTKENCPNLQKGANQRKRNRETLPEHWVECKLCSGDARKSNPSFDHFRALKNASK